MADDIKGRVVSTPHVFFESSFSPQNIPYVFPVFDNAPHQLKHKMIPQCLFWSAPCPLDDPIPTRILMNSTPFNAMRKDNSKEKEEGMTS
jgi:hypothetical protein